MGHGGKKFLFLVTFSPYNYVATFPLICLDIGTTQAQGYSILVSSSI